MMINEPLLEPVFRYLRFRKGLMEIRKTHHPLIIVDLGCGPLLNFYHFLKKHKIKIKKYFGIDPLVKVNLIKKYKKEKNIKIINTSLIKKIPLPSSFADYIFGFAFLEHIDHPELILREAVRIAKKNGKIIMTTPSPLAKFLLEILSKLKLVSSGEIKEHKNYFDKKALLKIIKGENLKIHHSYFEVGLNNLLVIEKNFVE